MKKNDLYVLIAFVSGGIAGLGLYWLMPGAHWAFYLVVGLLVAAGANQGLRESYIQDRTIEELEKRKT